MLIHAALELAIAAPGRLDCVSPGGPPFPACRVCNQRMRTRRMSIYNSSSLAHLRAQVGILSDVTLSFLRAPCVHLGGCRPFLFSFAFMEQLSTATPFPSLPSWCNPYKTVESSYRDSLFKISPNYKIRESNSYLSMLL